jgi:sporulation protein YlmC with PRC-barrel domain
MMRWRNALRREVVDTTEARATGRLDGLVVDPSRSTIEGLVVGGRIVDWSDAGGVGRDAITIEGDDLAHEARNDAERAAIEGTTDPIAKPVITEDGFEVGTVGDVEFDPVTGEITWLVLGDDRIKGSRLLGIGSYAVVVSSTDRASSGDDLASLSKDELYEMARERDVDGRSTMDKQQLIDALS